MRENQNQEAKKRKRKKKSKSEFNTKVYPSVWANGLLDKSLPFDWMRCCCCLLSSLLLGRKPTVRYGHPDAANHLILIKKVVWLNGRVRGRKKKKKCPTPVIPILLRRIGVTSTVIIILVDFSSPGRREKDGRRRKKGKETSWVLFLFFYFFYNLPFFHFPQRRWWMILREFGWNASHTGTSKTSWQMNWNQTGFLQSDHSWTWTGGGKEGGKG